MRRGRTALIVLFLLVCAASVVTSIEPWFQGWAGSRTSSANLLSVLLGDSRRLFAKHFYVKADAYFHSGYYPSIFDGQPDEEKLHMAANAGAGHDEHQEVRGRDKARDWIERFSRNFYPSVHTHLGEGKCKDADHDHKEGAECKDHHGQHDDCAHCKHHDHDEEDDHSTGSGGEERELLPWLKLAATLDPERPETYVTAAFWLRSRLGKANEAERFLREGLQSNPGDPELLFELGRIYRENHKDPATAHRIWQMALAGWHNKQRTLEEDSDRLLYIQITIHLAKLSEEQKDFPQTVKYLTLLLKASPQKATIEKWIADLQAQSTNAAPAKQAFRDSSPAPAGLPINKAP